MSLSGQPYEVTLFLPCFTGKETEVQRLNDLPKVTQLGSKRNGSKRFNVRRLKKHECFESLLGTRARIWWFSPPQTTAPKSENHEDFGAGHDLRNCQGHTFPFKRERHRPRALKGVGQSSSWWAWRSGGHRFRLLPSVIRMVFWLG